MIKGFPFFFVHYFPLVVVVYVCIYVCMLCVYKCITNSLILTVLHYPYCCLFSKAVCTIPPNMRFHLFFYVAQLFFSLFLLISAALSLRI